MLAQATIKTEPIFSKPVTASRWLAFYTTTIAVVGLVLIVLSLANLPADLFGLCLFALMAAITELLSVELFTSSRGSHVSLSSIVAIASIVAFGPFAGALTFMVSGVMTTFTTTFLQGQRPSNSTNWLRRSAFNIGMFVTAASAAGWTYVLLGGTPGDVLRLTNVIPLVCAVAVDALLNLLILLRVLVLQTGRNPSDIWNQDFKWSVPIAIVGGVVGGGALGIAHMTLGLLGVVVFFLPVISTSYSQRLYVAHSKVYVNTLEQLNAALRIGNLGLLETLGAVVDAFDIYTYGHSVQVATYAGALAEKMNLPRAEQELIVKAALVHDIGKVGVTDSIISKAGPLTADEYNIMKRHPVIGAEILKRMEGLHALVPIVWHHHERWDGKGYPDGLQDEEIPLGSRIITLADTLDVLCSDRPYRRTLSFREVKEEIERCAGAQFDPAVVEAFNALVREKPRAFFKNSAATVDRTILPDGSNEVNQDVLRFLKKSMVVEPKAKRHDAELIV